MVLKNFLFISIKNNNVFWKLCVYIYIVCGRMGTERTAISQRTRSPEADARAVLRVLRFEETQTGV